MTRRQLLARSAALLLSSSTLGSLLSACREPPRTPVAPGSAPTAPPTTAPPTSKPPEPLELRWISQRHPALDLAFERLQVWAQQKGNVRVVPAPITYEVYLDKLSAELLLSRPNAEIIWHNDDWGQLWGPYLEPLDDLKVIRDKTDSRMYDPFWIWEGNVTGLPWVETIQTFFIRKDLIPESEVLDWTFRDMVQRLTRLQADGKVKWGYVGGMKYPHTWFSWLWSIWANGSDLYLPRYERDNRLLQQSGWRPGCTEQGWTEVLEFWWNALFTTKICPPGMVGYTRTDADAVFMGGEAAMTSNDSPLLADYTNPQKSKIADRVGLAGFPVGPSGDRRTGHRAPWGFAVPRATAPDKKAIAKEALGFLLADEESQTQLWDKTGSVPPNLDVQKKLRKTDDLFDRLMTVTNDAPKPVLPAYYFAQWPQANATLSELLGKYMAGERSAALTVLDELSRALHRIPQV